MTLVLIIIGISALESSIKMGDRYEGLVDGVGYVYWKRREVYFIHKNQSNLFEMPIYEQIFNIWFRDDKSKTVHTITLYTLFVLSREELKKINKDMYAFYYGTIDAMEKLLSARDATRIAERPILIDTPPQQIL